VRLLDAQGAEVPDGQLGELFVNGPSAAQGYWRNHEKSLETFQGPWTKTGDIFCRDGDGRYRYCGRNDDMFKSGGNWVSPAEVESALIKHEKVLEAGVVGHADDSGNLKSKAFVVLVDPSEQTKELEHELQAFVKQRLELWKYPRWIEFVADLPKTATGKIQRYKLRTPGTP
jgi:4-hydroxybenzoate-CoA ligase